MLDWDVFNATDWVIIVVLAVSTGLSLWRGFVREALSLAGWIAAFLIANLLVGEVAAALSGVIDNATGRYVAAYAILFVGTLVAATVLMRLSTGLVNVSGLAVLDRVLGTVFGFARGIILIVVVVFVLRQLLPPRDLLWLDQSRLMPHLDMLVLWAQRVFAEVDAGHWRDITT
ncbi:MAG: CvpA family protein [Halioglobus sp.]|nr:CvpA family protein [Halioglobus sp.]